MRMNKLPIHKYEFLRDLKIEFILGEIFISEKTTHSFVSALVITKYCHITIAIETIHVSRKCYFFDVNHLRQLCFWLLRKRVRNIHILHY